MSEAAPRGSLMARLTRRGGLGRLMGTTLVLSTLGRAIQLALAVALGRSMGPEGFGVFTYAIGLAMLVQQVAGLGFAPLSMRFVTVYRERTQRALLVGYLRLSEAVMLGMTLAMAAGLGLAAWALPGDLAQGLALAALVVVPRGMLRLRNRQLAALRRPGKGELWETVFPNGATLVAALVGTLVAPMPAVAIYAGAAMVAVLMASWEVYGKLRPEIRGEGPDYALGDWLMPGVTAMGATITRNAINRVDVVLIGPLSDLTQVGLYGAAIRITYLLTFPQRIMAAVMGPRFAAHYAAGRRRALRRDYLLTLGVAAATALPVAVPMILLAEPVLDLLFGDPAFLAAAPVLVVLTWSQIAAAFAQAPLSLLVMTGHQRALFWINLTGAALNLGINLALIPTLGAQGAAWARLAALGLILAAALAVAERALRAAWTAPRPAAMDLSE